MRRVLVLTTQWYDVWFREMAQQVDLKVVWFDVHLSNVAGLAHLLDWADTVILEDGLEVHPELASLNGKVLSQFAGGRAELIGPPRDSVSGAGRPVLFVPSNDTHVRMFAPIAKRCSSFHFAILAEVSEGARQALSQLGLESDVYSRALLHRLCPSVVVLGNDWGPFERNVVVEARQIRVPTVCIQEGCLDFENAEGRNVGRMQHADFAFVQGAFTLELLKRHIYFVTGNPRFDCLRQEPLPSQPVVMVNVNFTYKVFEDWRERWVRSAVEAIREAGYDYFISQHPRDRGQFPDLNVKSSGAFVVHDQLRAASILITRFSTLVYEAMLMGRAVIYYNPHGEGMRTFNDDTTGGILIVRSTDELASALRQATAMLVADNGKRRRFINLHCNGADGRAAERCASALAAVPGLYRAMSSRQSLLQCSLEYVASRALATLYRVKYALRERGS